MKKSAAATVVVPFTRPAENAEPATVYLFDRPDPVKILIEAFAELVDMGGTVPAEAVAFLDDTAINQLATAGNIDTIIDLAVAAVFNVDAVVEMVTLSKTDEPSIMTKTITMNPDTGDIVSDGSSCKLSRGFAAVAKIDGMRAFAAALNAIGPEAALVLGVLRDDALMATVRAGEPVFVFADGLMPDPAPADTIARSLEHISWPKRQGLVLIDVDMKGMPEIVAKRVGGDPWGAIVRTAPAIGRAGHARKPSSSAGIIDAATGEVLSSGSGGLHVYLAAWNPADAKAFLTTLHQRLWLAGYGWGMVGGAGQFLIRSLVDTTVGSPERLIFEGQPQLGPGLARDPDLAQARYFPSADGVEPVDLMDLVSPLSAEEVRTYRQMITDERKRLDPEIKRVRAAWREAQAVRMVTVAKSRGLNLTLEGAREALKVTEAGILPCDFVLQMDDGTQVTVGEVLDDVETYRGRTLADPREGISYGRGKAMVMGPMDRVGSLAVFIHSFAHGGGRYLCALDRGRVVARVMAAADADAERVFRAALKGSLLEPGEIEVAKAEIAEAMKKAKRAIGKQMLNGWAKGLRTLAGRQAHDESEQSRENAGFTVDEAVALDAGPESPFPISMLVPDTHLMDAMAQIAEVVEQVPLADKRAMFRSSNHELSYVDLKSISTMSQLMSEAEREDGKAPEAAPALPSLIACATPGDVQRELCLWVRWQKRVKKDLVDAMLPADLAGHYRVWQHDSLPRVQSVSTLPIVSDTGRLFSGQGVDAQLKTFWNVDPAILAALPRRKTTREDAAAAWVFLRDELMGDVATDDAGKMALVAAICTYIERHVCPGGFPAFIITAPNRGSGKTSVVHMISTVCRGTMAAASPWASDPDERRKALYSLALAGADLVAFDNLAKGSRITDSVLELQLTTLRIRDRKLGESVNDEAPADFVSVFTGNAIAAKGDMVRRSITVSLDTGMPRPELRNFRHPDWLRWVRENRAKIMHAVYTILLVDRTAEDRAAPAKSGFPNWYRLIGQPLEIASGLDFGLLAAQAEDEDEDEMEVHGLLLALLRVIPAPALEDKPIYGVVWKQSADTVALTRSFLAVDLHKFMVSPEAHMEHFPSGPPSRNDIDKMRESVKAQETARDLATRLGALLDEDERFPVPSMKAITRRLKAHVGRPVDTDFGMLKLESATDKDKRAVFRVVKIE